jgi:beta-galactosidase
MVSQSLFNFEFTSLLFQGSITAFASGAVISTALLPELSSMSKEDPPCKLLGLTGLLEILTLYSGWSAWLNGQFLDSYLGDASAEQANLTLSFSNVTLNTDKPNILLVVQDDNGHDQTTGALNPRGILESRLIGSSTGFSHWRLAGTAGGESNIDPIRGTYNEDGLYGERVGWHLPGYDDSAWETASTKKNSAASILRVEGATVKFFRTSIPLDLPSGKDVSISFVFSSPSDSAKSYRAQLFVNGYQYGRYYPYVGNQVIYPVPPGILTYNGVNTIVVAIWSQTEEGASIGIDWRVNYVADSSLDTRNVGGKELRPEWTEERNKYA